MERPDWAPEGVDLEKPSAARTYDYLLGGSHNFEVDREAARQMMAVVPEAAIGAQANRAFLFRAVRYLIAAGVRQFLDIGSGVPTVGNVHEVAQRADPQARVVYVDFDPVAVAHSRAILAGNDRATVVQQDLRHPDAILAHPEVRSMLDFDQPVGVLVLAIVHAITDQDDPYQIVAKLGHALAPGSFLAISHATADGRAPEEWEGIARIWARATYPLTARSRSEVERLFAGFDLVEPGVVWVPQWRPEHRDEVGDAPGRTGVYAGVGRKP